ncbi:putative linoleate 9S-lipoxygenase 5 [Panicum miliaceum]|uniref:Lipoxygenase n=1 Tax=Panicum miliaceum TaxID=4540 RepID=A0A3L6S916_PANMI|nr:putative linoleate 9S-lipoxygenase 5 [Panicum miliaceum]
MAHPSRAQGWRGPRRYGRSPLIGQRWFLPPPIHVGGSSNPAATASIKLLRPPVKSHISNQLRLSFQLVSATVAGGDGRGLRGEEAVLEAILGGCEETEMDVKLAWREALGAPGAVVVKNHSDFPVYLKVLNCSAAAGLRVAVDFACNGWVYPVGKHPYRLFFTNDAYVKENTPRPLLGYREDELALLRGEGADERAFQECLSPFRSDSTTYATEPIPITSTTSCSYSYPHTETRVPLDQQIYVPCDERVGTDVIAAPSLPNLGSHFKSIAEIYSLIGLDDVGRLAKAKQVINSRAAAPKFPVPQVISAVNPMSWRRDEEFSRQMLAGTNPVCIKRVTKFPLTSDLDRTAYGDQDSKITEGHIEKNMSGITLQQALEDGRLFVVDHRDWVMPYLKRINELPGEEETGEISPRKAYAARTLLFLNNDSTLRPLAIELSSPHQDDEQLGSVTTVYTPPDTSDDILSANKFTAWDLAEAHATANDTSKNNFVIHWLNVHATMESLVIATNRQLSVLHPVHKLLKPHFRNTLHVNAVARQIIFGSGDRRKNDDIFRGIQEVTYLPSNGRSRNLDAIKKWVADYCAIYYVNDGAVTSDSELQAWWREVRHVGHGDLQDAHWWPAMDCLADLEEACTIIIWLGSAFHAAVGLGQYGYQGFVPNSPTLTSRPMPEAGAVVTEAEFLGSITPRNETLALMGMAAKSLARTGEVFLGQRPESELWTIEQRAAEALARFQERLQVVAGKIQRRNTDPTLKKRAGPVEVPYNMLTPTREPGPVSRGIPNSITN